MSKRDVVGTMIYVAKEGKMKDLKRLIEEQHVDVNATNSFGNAALIQAAQYDQREVVAYLLSREGVDANITTEDGRTAAHIAAYCGNDAILQILLEDGRVNLSLKDKKDKTALDLSIQANEPKCIALLRVRFQFLHAALTNLKDYGFI